MSHETLSCLTIHDDASRVSTIILEQCYNLLSKYNILKNYNILQVWY